MNADTRREAASKPLVGMALRAVRRLAWLIRVRTTRLAGKSTDGSESHPYRLREATGRFGGLFLLTLTVLAFAGCASVPTEHFAGAKPTFDPVDYFTGHTHSWGVFENRSGDPARRFATDCHGHLDGGVLVLDQTFTYDDGTRQERHWRIRRLDAHRYEATANDVVGNGAGEAYGNAFRWEYTVALKPGNPLFNVRLRQWMYLQEDGRTMVNRGSVSKFGVEIAQITEQFRRD